MFKSQRRSKGITLIELVIILVLLAILSVTTMVKFVTFDNIKVAASASKMSADIAYAQQLAITTQVFHGVRFDTANNLYFLFRGTPATKIKDPNNRPNDYIVDYDTEPEISGVTINTVNINSTSGIVFDALGRPYDGNYNLLFSGGSINLVCGTNSKNVIISPETGNISW